MANSTLSAVGCHMPMVSCFSCTCHAVDLANFFHTDLALSNAIWLLYYAERPLPRRCKYISHILSEIVPDVLTQTSYLTITNPM